MHRLFTCLLLFTCFCSVKINIVIKIYENQEKRPWAEFTVNKKKKTAGREWVKQMMLQNTVFQKV